MLLLGVVLVTVSFLGVVLLEESARLDGGDDDRARAGAVDEHVDEGVVAAAVLDDDVGVGDRQLVLRTRLVAVRVDRGAVDDAHDGREVPRERLRDVAVHVRGGDDGEAFGVVRGGGARTAGEGDRDDAAREEGGKGTGGRGHGKRVGLIENGCQNHSQ